MLWTVIGLSNNQQFVTTFYASHDGVKAVIEAQKKFNNVKVLAIVAGDHTQSTYVNRE
jgi:hypothetical protein